jgi:hypothetical protein
MLIETEDLGARFDRLIAHSETGDDVRSCLLQILDKAAECFRPELGTTIEHSALSIAKLAVMEGPIDETRAAAMLKEMSSLADDVADEAEALSDATLSAFETICRAYDWAAGWPGEWPPEPEATAANQGGR